MVESDRVDEIIAQWHRERPDLDVSGMEVIARLSRLDKAIRPLLDDAFAQHDLESWEFDVLATLLRHGAPHQLTPGELMDSVMITSGAMTNRIDRLERRGLVARESNPDDGRQVLVTLTPAGQQRVDAALVDHAANEARIVSALDPARRGELIGALRVLSCAVEDDGDSAS